MFLNNDLYSSPLTFPFTFVLAVVTVTSDVSGVACCKLVATVTNLNMFIAFNTSPKKLS